MCYKVDCKKCGKTTWGGCGKHLTTLYKSIEKGKHCTCNSWPGVVMPSSEEQASASSAAGKGDERPAR